MRPPIPHDPPKRSQYLEDRGDGLRWTRKLAEAGKLSGRSVKIPRFIPNLVVIGDWDVPA